MVRYCYPVGWIILLAASYFAVFALEGMVGPLSGKSLADDTRGSLSI